MTAEFFLEIGVEEIPAWMIEPALLDLRTALSKGLGDAQVQTYATPRRLVALVHELPLQQPDRTELLTGPPVKGPAKAAEGFAKKMGVSVEKLQRIETPKGEYWAFQKEEPGQETMRLLETLLPEAILAIHWPKTMYWTGKGGTQFIRPIRSLVALFGGRIVRFRVADVESGDCTFGHRTLGTTRLPVTNFAKYREVIRDNGVILDAAERREKILREATQLLPSGCKLRPNPGLVETLVYLTEFPTAALGSFYPTYLTLPEEVLVTVMEHHQKYLAVEAANGQLAPHFVFVMNRSIDSTGIVRHGNERVLRARFNDARFFWDTDQKIPLRDRGPMLEKVTFQAKLGSYAEKTKRVVDIVRKLASPFGADATIAVRAAELAKCDLTTELVKEFTELQGVVGGIYAHVQNESPDVGKAIEDHYKPESMEDRLPRTPEGAVLSVADKLDTLKGFFGLGLVPKGSGDPFALRRAAQGIIRIVAEDGYGFPYGDLELTRELTDFLKDRLRYYLRDVKGFAYDEVNAVLAVQWDIVTAKSCCEAIANVRPTPDFEPVCAAFKRVNNILTQAGGALKFQGHHDSSLLEDGAEKDLEKAAQKVISEAGPDPEDVMRRTATLRPFVDTYFKEVMVMDKDQRVRENRLMFLAWLLREFTRVADFSEIVTTKEKENRE